MNGPALFGSAADSYGDALGKLPVFVIGGDAMAQAYFEVAAARRRGEEFAVLLLVTDRRAAYAYEIAEYAVKSGDYGAQRQIFDAIDAQTLIVNSKPISELSADDPTRALVMDISHLADTLVVRSWSNAESQRAMRGYSYGQAARWYPQRDLGNAAPGTKRDTVVIWAPNVSAEKTAIHTFSLHNLHAPVVVVSRGGTGLSQRARYIDVSSPELPSVLARALCVVDTSLDDPSWVQAFAARGFSVAATTTSGAREVADALALYDPWSHKSIWAATVEALGRPASVAVETPPSADVILRSLEAARPKPPARTPLVTTVTPTYNREEHLRRSIGSLLAQTYKNLEIIVVNDGGRRVSGLPDDPRIRIVEREVNVGVTGALNAGMALATGEYIQLLADDDELYPDHIMRLLEALERTGADVAHSNILIRYEGERDGVVQTIGYNASVFCQPLDRTEVYAASPVAGQAQLVRRSTYERVGPFDDRVILSDQEMQIRLSEVSDFVHVPRITGEWLARESGDQIGGTKAKDFPEDLRRIFQLHPVPDSPYIAAVRERTLKNVASRPPGFVFPPVISVLPPQQMEEQVRSS